MAPLKAARCLAAIRKTERAGMPPIVGYSGLPGKLDSIESEGNGGSSDFLSGERPFEVSVWPGPSLHQSLMRGILTLELRVFLNSHAQARRTCSQLLVRGLQRLDPPCLAASSAFSLATASAARSVLPCSAICTVC